MKIYKNQILINCKNCKLEINSKNNFCGNCGSENLEKIENEDLEGIAEAVYSVDLEDLDLSSRLEIYNFDSEYFIEYFKNLKIHYMTALTRKNLVNI